MAVDFTRVQLPEYVKVRSNREPEKAFDRDGNEIVIREFHPVLDVDQDVAYPAVLELFAQRLDEIGDSLRAQLGTGGPEAAPDAAVTAYWIECAHQFIKMDLQRILWGEFGPFLFEIRFEGGPGSKARWRLDNREPGGAFFKHNLEHVDPKTGKLAPRLGVEAADQGQEAREIFKLIRGALPGA